MRNISLGAFAKVSLLLFIFTATLCTGVAWGIDQPSAPLLQPPKDYFSPLNAQEQADIGYLISTLGESSYFTLLARQKKLQETGDRTGHIHPMRFFAYVFSNPQLKQSMQKIKGMPWRRFRDGMAGSFEQAWERGDVNQEVIQDFAVQAGVSPQYVNSFVERRDWKALLDGVRTGGVPQENEKGSKRT